MPRLRKMDKEVEKKTKKITKKKLKVSDLDKIWSKLVRDRDGTCVHCGRFPVQAHHIFGRGYKSTRWNLDNGISLCYKCHMFWAHSKYEEFRDWIIETIGEEKYLSLKEQSQVIWTGTLQEEEETLIKTISIQNNRNQLEQTDK